ncbi:MAG: redoxin domain-containing protein [Gammaproteobacteria bacterium]|nr:redoxin domain-containing protein [Gammaproteobacteria bacterium]
MSATVKIDQAVPQFSLPATNDRTISSSDLAGHNTVIYFYPKDSTPGCTLESQGFRDAMADFEACNAVIIGVSRDSLRSHENFRAKQCLPFDLICDGDEVLCKLFDVIRMKNMYGKQVRGIERSTFLIDRDGVLRREWRKVKVNGHVVEVLEAARTLG